MILYMYNAHVHVHYVCCIHSMRVLPHHQDTGGFFIAVLEKKDWLPWQRKQKRTQQSTAKEMESAETTENIVRVDDAETSNDTNADAVPKLKDLAHKAIKSVELSKVEEEDTSNSGCSASVGTVDGDRTGNGHKRTSVNPEESCESIPGDEEVVSKTESTCSSGQERPSKSVLGK